MFKDIQATIHIDLDKNLEELWNSLDKDARWGVNRARKENLRLQIVNDENFWKEFYDLYISTILDGGVTPKKIEELKSENPVLFLCFRNEELIAGAAIKTYENKTELFLNASKKDALKYQPNNFLYWEIIEWSKKNGFKIFDLGGYQLNAPTGSKLEQINKFKERWGGKVVTFKISSVNPLYIIGRKLIRNFPFIKKIRDKLKVAQWKRQNQKDLI